MDSCRDSKESSPVGYAIVQTLRCRPSWETIQLKMRGNNGNKNKQNKTKNDANN